MRVNIYAEEMTDRVEIVCKGELIGVRFYLYLPVTVPYPDALSGAPPTQERGPFIHHEGDDDSSAITFWGKSQLAAVLWKALSILDKHHQERRQT